MGRLRVRSASLALRLPELGRKAAPRVAETVEKAFIPAVLDALRRELDAAYGPEAVIRIDRLRLRLTIGPDIRDGAELARQVARDLAGGLRAAPRRIRPGQSTALPETGICVWPDAAAFQLSALRAARGRVPGPSGAIETVEAVLRRLADAPAGTVAAVIEQSATSGDLSSLLAEASEGTALRIGQVVAGKLSAPAATAFARARRRQAPPAAAPAATRGAQAKTPRSEAPETEPRRQGDPVEDSAPEALRPGRPPPAPDDPADPGPEAHASDGPEPPRKPVRPRPSPAAPAPSPAQRPPAHTARAPDEPPARRRDSPAEASAPPPGSAADPLDGAVSFETRWGRLPCLLNVALRLEMPERLWRIGVPEGAALAGMLAAATASATDPVVGLLAPEFPDLPPPVPEVPDWARDEFRAGVLDAASGCTGVSPDRIDARHAALAEGPEWRLDAWGAAALVVSLEGLLDRRLDGAALDRLFGCTGAIEVTEDKISVRLPIDAIDLDLRRTGLDENPGYLSWLDRRMVLGFGNGEEEWLP